VKVKLNTKFYYDGIPLVVEPHRLIDSVYQFKLYIVYRGMMIYSTTLKNSFDYTTLDRKRHYDLDDFVNPELPEEIDFHPTPATTKVFKRHWKDRIKIFKFNNLNPAIGMSNMKKYKE